MTQAEFNKLDAKEIQLLLRRHPNQDKTQEAALALLGRTAQDWWAHRSETIMGRIIDPETGKWKTPFTANGRTYHIIGACPLYTS